MRMHARMEIAMVKSTFSVSQMKTTLLLLMMTEVTITLNHQTSQINKEKPRQFLFAG